MLICAVLCVFVFFPQNDGIQEVGGQIPLTAKGIVEVQQEMKKESQKHRSGWEENAGSVSLHRSFKNMEEKCEYGKKFGCFGSGKHRKHKKEMRIFIK